MRGHGIAIIIDSHDVGKYAEAVKAELKGTHQDGYSVETMLAMTGLIKLQEELPSWLDIDTSDAMDGVVVETIKDL